MVSVATLSTGTEGSPIASLSGQARWTHFMLGGGFDFNVRSMQ